MEGPRRGVCAPCVAGTLGCDHRRPLSPGTGKCLVDGNRSKGPQTHVAERGQDSTPSQPLPNGTPLLGAAGAQPATVRRWHGEPCSGGRGRGTSLQAGEAGVALPASRVRHRPAPPGPPGTPPQSTPAPPTCWDITGSWHSGVEPGHTETTQKEPVHRPVSPSPTRAPRPADGKHPDRWARSRRPGGLAPLPGLAQPQIRFAG